MAGIRYEITEKLGVLSTGRSEWTKEVNMVSWNGKSERLDIREWSPEHDKMSKGITLSREEAMRLHMILDTLFK